MEESLKKITAPLLVAAILSLFGAMWRFEGVAAEVKQVKIEMKDYYAKKSDVKLVEKELTHLKEGQTEIRKDIKELLRNIKKYGAGSN